jgi:hypothetical protein
MACYLHTLTLLSIGWQWFAVNYFTLQSGLGVFNLEQHLLPMQFQLPLNNCVVGTNVCWIRYSKIPFRGPRARLISKNPLRSSSTARILRAHSHSMSGGSIWASLECQCCFWIAGGLVSYLTQWLYSPSSYSKTALTLKRSSDWTSTHWVWVHVLLEYGRALLISYNGYGNKD